MKAHPVSGGEHQQDHLAIWSGSVAVTVLPSQVAPGSKSTLTFQLQFLMA